MDNASQSQATSQVTAMSGHGNSGGIGKRAMAESFKARRDMTPEVNTKHSVAASALSSFLVITHTTPLEVKRSVMKESMKDAVLSMRDARKPITSYKDVRLKEKMWRKAKQLEETSNQK